jgi:hypothetical protein
VKIKQNKITREKRAFWRDFLAEITGLARHLYIDIALTLILMAGCIYV